MSTVNPNRELFLAETEGDIQACFPVFHALRPHLVPADFLPQIRRQQSQGYQILALRDEGAIKSVAGFRYAEFLYCGPIIYIDDLATLPGQMCKGYASAVLDWVIAHALTRQCRAVHLDSGYSRHTAHKLYLRKGFVLNAHHFALEL